MARIQKNKSKDTGHDNCYHSRLKVLETMTAILAKTTSNDLQALKPKTNRHDDDFDILDKSHQHFMIAPNENAAKQQ